MRRYKPGNPCCCLRYFDEYLTNRLGTDYNNLYARSLTDYVWSVTGGQLVYHSALTTPSSFDWLVTAHGATPAFYKASADITLPTINDAGRVLIDATSTSWMAAEIKPGGSSGTLRLLQRSGTSETAFSSLYAVPGLTAGTTANVCISKNAGAFRAKVTGAGITTTTVARSVGAFSGSTGQAGIGISGGTHDATFDNLRIEYVPDQNPICTVCSGVSATCGCLFADVRGFDITFGSIGNTAYCPTCSTLNGLWTSDFGYSSLTCSGSFGANGLTCSSQLSGVITIAKQGSIGLYPNHYVMTIHLQIQSGGFTSAADFAADLGADPIDCLTINSLGVPCYNPGPSGPPVCDLSVPTCTVSAFG